jgi:hypothetical protein
MFKNIDKKIIGSTECEKSFECLKTQKNLCKVKLCIAGQVHFLRYYNKQCKFHALFQDEPMCTCPVRQEIYNLYEI